MDNRKRVSTTKFKEILKTQSVEQDAIKDLVVCRATPFGITKEQSDPDLTRTFTISTPAVDREGDRLMPTWELDNYNKGGSILWGHDSRSTPMHVVAAPLSTWQDGDRLKSRAKFTTREINPIGFMTYQLIEFGALRSSSVGFLPKDWDEVEERDGHDIGPWGAYDFKRQELLEWSVVPVPANPEALVDAKGSGIDISPLQSWAEEALDKNLDLVVVERDLLEAAWKVTAGNPKSVTVPKSNVVEIKTVIPYKKYPLADKDAEWDGPKETAAADVDKLKIMSTWYDTENADVKSGYKLPHHQADGFTTVWRGVTAAMGALLGARGGVAIPDADRKGVYNHLAKHYKDFDEEPPEFKDYTAEELADLFPEERDTDPTLAVTETVTRFVDAQTKSGRVLSAANEQKIREARDRLSTVLEQIETQESGDDDDKGVEPEPTEVDYLEVLATSLQSEETSKTLDNWIEGLIDNQLQRLTGSLGD